MFSPTSQIFGDCASLESVRGDEVALKRSRLEILSGGLVWSRTLRDLIVAQHWPPARRLAMAPVRLFRHRRVNIIRQTVTN